MSHHIHYRLIALAALLLVASGAARAACGINPILLPVHLRVGSDTQHCQYNDIQSAISAVSECPTVIDITREHTYTNQHLSIDNKPNLTLQGWGDGVTCAQIHGPLDFPPYAPPTDITPLVSLDGSGSGGRVLTITGGSNVTLRNLTVLRGATDGSASGGGIDFNGNGSLTLTRSTVSYNNAGYGAGINMNGSSGAATLTLASDTLVILNTASTSGGGIRVQGNTRFYALQPKTLIGYNHAPNGYGGGVEVLGPARADIGSSGYNGLAVIYDNDAQYGGGMDILNFQDQADAIVRVFTTDAHNPVQVSGNFASHTGGGFYLRPYEAINSVGGGAILCAYDFRIEDNAAQEGAAIYADADYDGVGNPLGGGVALNTNPQYFRSPLTNYPCVQPEPPTALGAVACAAGVACNVLSANKAEDGNGNPTDGSTILLQTAADLEADRFIMRANTGAHVLREVGDNRVFAALSNCLLAGNVLARELIAQTDGSSAQMEMGSCTIAGNQIAASNVLLAPGTLFMHNSIIDQPGRTTINPAETDPAAVVHVLSNDRSTLPDTPYIQQGEPTFVDAANGDFHLRLTSLGIDSAPVETGSDAPKADLDRHARVYDQPGIANNFGPMDLGAYELQPLCAHADTVYCDGFEP
jgi:predicted outer membrane repeat protein